MGLDREVLDAPAEGDRARARHAAGGPEPAVANLLVRRPRVPAIAAGSPAFDYWSLVRHFVHLTAWSVTIVPASSCNRALGAPCTPWAFW